MRKTDASNAKNQDTSHATSLTSDVMNVMNLDTFSWTALTEYPLQEHQHHTSRDTEIATTDLVLGTAGKTEKEETGPDHSLDTANIIVPAIMTHTEAVPNHNNGTGTATIEAAQENTIQHTKDTATGPAMTHHTGHIANPLHTAAHQVTALRIAVDHIHDNPTDCQSIVYTKKDHAVWDYTPTKETKSPT